MPRTIRPAESPARSPDSAEASADEQSARVLRRFRLIFNAVKTHFRQVEKRAGIGGAQVWALSVVEAQPGIGVGALARAMDVHQTTASNLVRALIAQGLLESQRNGTDRRATQLQVTSDARRILAKAPGPFSGVLPAALARLDRETLARLEQDLGALLALLDADERAARIPLAQL